MSVNPSNASSASVAQGKNLILLLDGTWNDSEFSETDTNIVRLREKISAAMHASTMTTSAGATGVQQGHAGGRRNVVLYQRGVGTGPLKRLRGGIFGAGLADNVRNAYRFVCANYKPNDKIFIFGFSRGAFTARSLAGYIAAAGILHRNKCTAPNESRAWHYYRTAPAERLSGVAHAVHKHAHPPVQNLIECIGIFDTVGALGVPFRWFSKLNRSLYEFHDVLLSSISRTNLHAIAIDEHRWPFAATLWRKTKYDVLANATEQVWFAGSHSDVGGGNVTDTGPSANLQLEDISLDWMLKRVQDLCPDFPALPLQNFPSQTEVPSRVEARRWLYYLYPFAHRSIGGHRVPKGLWRTTVGLDRHNISENEQIHISAIEFFGRPSGRWARKYRPRNLEVYLRACANGAAVQRIPIVDWNGTVIPQTNDLVLMQAALKRL